MSKYVVIPIQISLKNKKFAESGEVVDESQLNSPTHELVSGNFIRLATEEEIEASGQVVEETDKEDSEEDDDSVKDTSKTEDAGDDKSKESTAEISKKDAVKAALKSEK